MPSFFNTCEMDCFKSRINVFSCESAPIRTNKWMDVVRHNHKTPNSPTMFGIFIGIRNQCVEHGLLCKQGPPMQRIECHKIERRVVL